MKNYILPLLLLIVLPISSMAQNLSAKDKAAILKVFNAQEDCWNTADIDCFMEGYWESDSLMFIGGSGPKYGYDVTLQRYKKSYPDKATMGKLTFTILKMKKMGPKSAWVLGKWHLKREVGDIGGHFTLVWRKIKGEWVIVSDHTSTED